MGCHNLSLNSSHLFHRLFAVTWLGYFGYYLCRKNFSVLMPYFKQDLGFSSTELAAALTLYSAAYCAGQFINGWMSDRFGARYIVTLGMMLSAASSALMSFGTQLTLLQGVNGYAQSTGWPGLLKLTRDWFPAANRGIVMGFWGTNMVLGGLAGTWLATWAATGGFARAAWLPGLVLTSIALILFATVRDKPPTTTQEHSRLQITPPLLAIAGMYFCAKMCRYAFLFWLPLYMTEHLQYSKSDAGYASGAYELIGFLGALLAGYVSERPMRGRRFEVAGTMMLVQALICFAFVPFSALGYWQNVIAISLAGVFLFGPDTLMAGATVQDVAPPGTTASAGGFVNGVGSIGQILSPMLVAEVSSRYGWGAVFPVLGVVAAVGGLILTTQWSLAAVLRAREAN